MQGLFEKERHDSAPGAVEERRTTEAICIHVQRLLRGILHGTGDRCSKNVNRDRHRKERMAYMAKKRSCRRTEDENKTHEKAVKLEDIRAVLECRLEVRGG